MLVKGQVKQEGVTGIFRWQKVASLREDNLSELILQCGADIRKIIIVASGIQNMISVYTSSMHTGS